MVLSYRRYRLLLQRRHQAACCRSERVRPVLRRICSTISGICAAASGSIVRTARLAVVSGGYWLCCCCGGLLWAAAAAAAAAADVCCFHDHRHAVTVQRKRQSTVSAPPQPCSSFSAIANFLVLSRDTVQLQHAVRGQRACRRDGGGAHTNIRSLHGKGGRECCCCCCFTITITFSSFSSCPPPGLQAASCQCYAWSCNRIHRSPATSTSFAYFEHHLRTALQFNVLFSVVV